MEKRKRPCQVKTRRYAGGKMEDLEFEGLFHEWGNEAEDGGEHGFGNFSVGIIEDESGQVHTVNPNHIKFTDK